MNVLKNIFRNRLMAGVVLVGAMVASTGCDELNQLRNMMQLLAPGLQSPLAGPLQPGQPWGDDAFGFEDPFGFDGSDDFYFDDDF